MTSKEILKSHLINILSDIIITIKDEEEIYDQAYANKAIGSITLNLSSPLLSITKTYELDKKNENNDININIALILFIELFHEIFGHKKGGYSQKSNDILLSPNVFYDKKKKSLLKLVNKFSQDPSKDEIRILREGDSDAGYFLEYFVGECKYGYFCDYIEIMLANKVNLNFIFDNDLWNEKIEIMRNYIKLKYMIYKHDKNLLDIKKYNNINEEIIYLQKIVDEKHITIEILNEDKNEKENEEKKILQRKRKDLYSFDINKQKKIEKFEKLSNNEIKIKMNSDDTPPEIRRILFNILLKRIRKK